MGFSYWCSSVHSFFDFGLVECGRERESRFEMVIFLLKMFVEEREREKIEREKVQKKVGKWDPVMTASLCQRWKVRSS